MTRSSDVTGDISYTPSDTTKLKWNGKVEISTRKLHDLREKQINKIMGSSSSQITPLQIKDAMKIVVMLMYLALFRY